MTSLTMCSIDNAEAYKIRPCNLVRALGLGIYLRETFLTKKTLIPVLIMSEEKYMQIGLGVRFQGNVTIFNPAKPLWQYLEL